MSIVLRIENLDCKSICNKIQKFLQKNKPDPAKYYLTISLSEIVDGGDNHIPKIEHKEDSCST
jgi:hypothetical protein